MSVWKALWYNIQLVVRICLPCRSHLMESNQVDVDIFETYVTIQLFCLGTSYYYLCFTHI